MRINGFSLWYFVCLMSHTTDVACDNQHSNAFRNDGVTRVNNVVARVNYGDDAIQVIAIIQISCTSHSSWQSMHVSLLHNPTLMMPVK